MKRRWSSARANPARDHLDSRTVIRLAAGLLVAVVIAAIAHRAGISQGKEEERMLAASCAEQQAIAVQQRSELDSLRQQVATLRSAAEIDRAAASAVRSDAARAQATIVALQQEIVLLKSITDPSVRTKGLAVHSFEVRQLPDADGAFRYQLIVLQRAQRQSALSGFVTLDMIGREGGKQRTIPMHELASGEERKAGRKLALDFVYYQVLEGEIILPDGFTPTAVRVYAEAARPRPQRIDRTVEWQLVEN